MLNNCWQLLFKKNNFWLIPVQLLFYNTDTHAVKVPSPSYVQYMYSICTVFVRFRSVHILYIYCTYTVQRPWNVAVCWGRVLRCGVVLSGAVRRAAAGTVAVTGCQFAVQIIFFAGIKKTLYICSQILSTDSLQPRREPLLHNSFILKSFTPYCYHSPK